MRGRRHLRRLPGSFHRVLGCNHRLGPACGIHQNEGVAVEPKFMGSGGLASKKPEFRPSRRANYRAGACCLNGRGGVQSLPKRPGTCSWREAGQPAFRA